MAEINLLEASVYNRIAAGEVVERPSSIVKELVENSLDAGATSIVIDVTKGGKEKIRISDNGKGIAFDDLPRAFLPHATSKIARVEDLDSIATLGFRGEALASIAAVADVEVLSKPASAELGGKITIENGVTEVSEAGCPDGTYFTVKNVFSRIPARAKFMDTDRREETAITDLMTRLILSKPDVSFRYVSDGRKIYQSYGQGIKDALRCIYGADSIDKVIWIDQWRGDMHLYGCIGRENYTKPNRTYQTLVVNNRYVSNQTVSNAVHYAYSDRLMKRQFPFYVLYLDLPVESVDVNVHPNKLDVRFENKNEIYAFVHTVIASALATGYEIPDVSEREHVFAPLRYRTEGNKQTLLRPTPATTQAHVSQSSDVFARATELMRKKRDEEMRATERMRKKRDEEIRIEEEEGMKRLEQAKGINAADFIDSNRPGFVIERDELATDPRGIVASIEDIPYNDRKDPIVPLDAKPFVPSAKPIAPKTEEQAIAPIAVGKTPIPAEQTSPVQEQMSLTAQEALAPECSIVGVAFRTYLIVQMENDLYFIDQHAAHERLLYDRFKARSECTEGVQDLLLPYVFHVNTAEDAFLQANLAAVNGLGIALEPFGPLCYKISAVPTVLAEMKLAEFVNALLKELSVEFAKTSSDLIKDRLMQEACKAAVKGGDELTKEELGEIMEQVYRTKATLMCPHGRPIAVKVDRKTIEKWFKRIVG